MRYQSKGKRFFRRPEVREEIAIAHDYLTQKGGAERVVLAFHKAFPDAKIYTTLYDAENTYPEFKEAEIVVSPLNRIAAFRHNHRLALPLLPFAASVLKVPARKTLVSSTGWAHGFNFADRSLVYCHSPARWVYLSEQYLGDNSSQFVSLALKLIRPALKIWDKRAAHRAGTYLANSTAIKERIYNVYGKDVKVLYPPFTSHGESHLEPISGLENFMADADYFLTVSRLLPYKNIDKVIEAFKDKDKKLLVVGAGPLADTLQALATENIQFASNISDAELRYAYANCKALLAISHEDFGLTPLEAGSWGKPTIALHAGGYLDTIIEGLNGHFIEQPLVADIRDAVDTFESSDWDSEKIKQHVDCFSEERFIQDLHSYIDSL